MEKKFIEGKATLAWTWPKVVVGFIGGFVTIFLLLSLSSISTLIWFMPSFGSGCVLAYAAWDSPFAQPRNIIGGHLISSSIGIAIYHTIGNSHLAIAFAVGLAIAVMIVTKTVHPPAGADPIFMILNGSSWSFLLSPVLIGSVTVVIVVTIINRLAKRAYPSFWF